ncbi:MAG TPA: hypothetical protein VJR95_13955 [Rhodanobacter sp.]|nr:hypothetical protein [Rhodanobacter sp.]
MLLTPWVFKPQKNQGPHWAGLGRVSGGVAFSYARARQRLALLFARLLLTAATKPRAVGAVAFGNMAVVKVMGRLEQNAGARASDDSA